MGVRIQPFLVWDVTFGKEGRRAQAGVEQYGRWLVYGQRKFVQLYLWRALAGSYGEDMIGSPTVLLMGECPATMETGLTMSMPRRTNRHWLHKVEFGYDVLYGQVFGRHIQFIQELKLEDSREHTKAGQGQ